MLPMCRIGWAKLGLPRAPGVTQASESICCHYPPPVCGPGSGHIGQGCIVQGYASTKSRILQGTHSSRDASSKVRILKGMHPPRDAFFKGRILQGTHPPRELWSLIKKYGDCTYGEASSWHRGAFLSGVGGGGGGVLWNANDMKDFDPWDVLLLCLQEHLSGELDPWNAVYSQGNCIHI